MATETIDILGPLRTPDRPVHMLSKKPIPRNERLIFALDVSTTDEAERLVDELGDSVQFYKLGLEIFMAGGYFDLLDKLTKQGKKAFVDLKFFDVAETVASAVRQLRGKGAAFATVHAGNDDVVPWILDTPILQGTDRQRCEAMYLARSVGEVPPRDG